MIVEKSIMNRLGFSEKNYDYVYDTINIGTEPETSDILACMSITWFPTYVDRFVSIKSIFQPERPIVNMKNIRSVTIKINILSKPQMVFYIKPEELELVDGMSHNDVEAHVYQYSINALKKEFPKASIYFKLLAQLYRGEDI